MRPLTSVQEAPDEPAGTDWSTMTPRTWRRRTAFDDDLKAFSSVDDPRKHTF